MADSFPKGQQPVKPHRHSRLRNEYRASSTDEEDIVEARNSDAVLETQLQRPSSFDVFNHDNDKKSDYGNDDAFDDVAFLERTSVMKETELAGPASQEWTLLSRELLRVDQGPPPSFPPVFAFNQPSTVAKRGNPHNVDLKSPQTSATHFPNIGNAPGLHTKDNCRTVAATTHPQGGRRQDMQSDISSHSPPSLGSPRTETGAHEMKSRTRVSGTEENRSHRPGKQSTISPSAQATTPSRATDKTYSTRKTGRSRNRLSTQQQGQPWPPCGNHASLISHRTTASPSIALTNMECVIRDQHGDPDVKNSVGESLEDISGDNEFPEDVRGSNACPSHCNLDADMPNDMPNDQGSHGITKNLVSSCKSQTPPASPVVAAVVAKPALMADVEDLPLCVPDEINADDLRTDLHHARGVDTSTAGQTWRPNFAVGESMDRLTDDFMEMPQQQTHNSTPMQNTPPRQQNQRSINEAISHKTSTQGRTRVSKVQKKSRGTSSILSSGPQAAAVPSTIDSHMNALRVSLLADQFRKEHEQSNFKKHYEDTIANLNEQIKVKEEAIFKLRGSQGELECALNRLTEKAKTNQKYVAGLQKDYDKVQKLVKTFQAQNAKTLREKITEIETERQSMCRHLESTLDSFAKLKRNMKETIDDLYVRLTISESKRAGHVETLIKQNSMLQEERTKRDALEKSLLASVQTIQQQIGENTLTLITKLETFQSLAAKTSDLETQTSVSKECLAAIHCLQSRPFLTIENIQRAERMLRSVHERLDTGFSSISAFGKSKDMITEETQNFIKTQMQTLKSDILQHEEVVAEYQKTDKANVVLKAQLEKEQQQYGQLDAQLKSLHQAESDLKTRYLQLECKLRDSQNANQEQDSTLKIERQELSDLRQRFKQASEDLNLANEKVLQVERLRQEQEKKTNQLENKCTTILADLRKMAAASKQTTKPEDMTKLREKIVEEVRKEVREKESGYKNEVHRLTLERDEKEQLRQKLHNELNVSKNQVHDLRKEGQTRKVELHSLLKENEEAKLVIESLRQSASAVSATGPQLATVTDHLRKKTDELQAKAQDHAILQQQFAESRDTIAGLQGSHDQLQTQIFEHRSAIETLRQEAEDRLAESQRDTTIAIETSRRDASRIREEKEAVILELAQAHLREHNLQKHEAELICERDNWERKFAEHYAAHADKDAETVRLRADAVRDRQDLIDKHRTELEACNHRQAKTDIALKEAEVELCRKDDEYHARVTHEREKAETERSRIVKQFESVLQSKREQRVPDQQEPSSSLGNVEPSNRPKLNLKAGSNRKKVSRQSNSTTSVAGSFAEQLSRDLTSDVHRQSSDHSENLFEERNRIRNSSNQRDHSQLNPAPEPEPILDAQDAEAPSMSMDEFWESLNQASKSELGIEKASSTDLSLMNSDALDHLGRDIEQPSSSNYAKSKKHVDDALIRSDNVSESGSASSQSHERPKSRANTASRLMPPTVTIARHAAVHQPKGDDSRTVVQAKCKLNETSSLNGMAPPLRPVKKQTYSQRQSILTRPEPGSPDPLQGLDLTYSQKRKNAAAFDRSMTKKPRSSSQYPVEDQSFRTKHSSSYSSKPSTEASNSKIRSDSLQTPVDQSAGSRSRTRNALSTTFKPRASNQNAPPDAVYHSRNQQTSSSSARGKEPTRRSTRSKSRGYDMFDQRFNQELP
ncbi:hypothetical protein IAQ61_001469 [Plenodomus lingam]|uniref:uncharacterized protein n=1 Tax=Leptosphaeria maculans TaxID=5022 RepID=UPI00331D7B1B|nr:hypothetical protein IAQ61_001469 [Plenodomus lingam]